MRNKAGRDVEVFDFEEGMRLLVERDGRTAAARELQALGELLAVYAGTSPVSACRILQAAEDLAKPDRAQDESEVTP